MAHEPTQEGLPETDAEWRERLDDDEYYVLREAGTEPPGSGTYLKHDGEGRYACAGCGLDLFTSEEKYDSGCGWPAFWDPADHEHLETRPDHSHGMVRTEVVCARCGGHLGHVFDDGPEPTGKRYCINSAALEFEEDG